ncbi:MAG: apolipoprotein N-acyltransferase [Rhodospirillales bacterium]|nr:apolipoprotein N-acyltransferase [Rhodospirillales bacterium]
MALAGAGARRVGSGSLAGQPYSGGGAIVRVSGWLRQLKGWRRALAAAILGAAAVLALPPVYALPVLIVAFTGLLWLLEGTASVRASAIVGLLFGLGYFTAGLYWVANALLTKPEEFGWLAPFAPLGLAAILAPFCIVPALAARWLTPRPGAARVIVLAGSWTLAEWLRSWMLTGFPWNLVGSAWTFADATMQPAAWIGTYGLGLITVLAAAMPAVLADAGRADPRTGRRWRAPAAAAAALALVMVAGAIRLWSGEAVGVVDGVRLRLVQPNIDQSIKWRRDLLDRHLEDQAMMGAWPGEEPPTHVIWSEVAAPMFITEDPSRLALIGRHTPPGGLTVLGTLRRSGDADALQLWNSVVAIDSEGNVVGDYDKAHLVPFGEYMPLRWLTNIGNFTVGFADFSAGPGIATQSWPGLPPVSPLICYEVIFPAAVARRDQRPHWLLNLTNDGWYGHSAGPYQHFAASRLRAVEEGLPLVRVANTGISAIIDPYGRVVERLGLGVRGVVDGDLPERLDDAPLYARTGNALILPLAVALTIFGTLKGRSKSSLIG